MRYLTLLLAAALSLMLPAAGYAADADGGGTYLIRHFDGLPGKSMQVSAMSRQYAVAPRKDPGAVRYHVLRWDGHANHFTLVEVWRDARAWQAKAALPHNREFRASNAPLEGAPYGDRSYVRLD